MKILVINAGSSSLKYKLMDPETRDIFAKGQCERIGIDGKFTYYAPHKPAEYEVNKPMPTHIEAIQTVLDTLTDSVIGILNSLSEIDAVGHRVVHGGETFNQSVLIDEQVIQDIEDCIPIAPLHNPANLAGIRACQREMPNTPMVAVFDTAFHQTMPPKAYMYALPYEYYQKYKIRRYGFHGTSHKYILRRAAVMLKKRPEEFRLISCHLGNGSSVAAIEHGRSIDTSMGFTPLAGLPMGTRAGDLDAGILQYLMDHNNWDIDQMLDILNHQSGMKGISGVSSDVRDLEIAYRNGNRRAELALEMLSYDVKKLIGAYAAAMGGVDAIAFTAGVGENDVRERMDILSNLEFLGVKINPKANQIHRDESIISTHDSRVKVMVIPTDEELMIAIDTVNVMNLYEIM